jgi:septal ring factor EnvC (AmiA/AmiB activator)
MPEERRSNEILDRLSKIQDDITQTKVDLALNTQSTAGIEKHLSDINGKVMAHNASIQALQAQATVASTFIAEATKSKEKREINRSVIYSRAMWAVIGATLVIVQRIVTYLIQNDFIKQIIK